MKSDNIFTELNLEIKLSSDSLIGSGQGYGVLIDSDVVFDKYGLPYIPAKRIKGLLRDSASELMKTPLGSNINIDEIFGKAGEDCNTIIISDFKLKNYDLISEWMNFLKNKNDLKLFSVENIQNQFTLTRSQTSIVDDDELEDFGTAKKNSLRTIRVLKKGREFYGKLKVKKDFSEFIEYTVKNLKWLGTKRNRGFGNVKCRVIANGGFINV